MKPEETEAETVFSAHAEVVPRTLVLMFCLVSILRARGGSSQNYSLDSPRYLVFSAHAEVVPKMIQTHGFALSILRARGGSSTCRHPQRKPSQYSPRTRR